VAAVVLTAEPPVAQARCPRWALEPGGRIASPNSETSSRDRKSVTARFFAREAFARCLSPWPQGPPVMGLGGQDLGACGWVTYGSRRLEAGKTLPGVPVMLAFEENGQPFETARFDPATGRLAGKGPVRVIVPQAKVAPPDLPQFADASCPGKVDPAHRFHEEYDHNAGASAYAIVAVRVKPLPDATRDIDWQSAASRALADGAIVFFGALKAR